MYKNVIYNGDKGYNILDVVPISNFKNSDGNTNKQVLGLYVNEKGGDHVLQKQNKFLICKEIEEATIIESSETSL